MPHSGDLIHLSPLVLSDTFNTWLNRTNEIIDAVNPFQVYEVDVGLGTTSTKTAAGLRRSTGISSGYYNGVVSIAINPGPGIGYESLSGESRAVISFADFATYGRVLSGTGSAGSATRVASNDEYIINDVSEGVAKKVQARNMFPPELVMDTLTISGNVVILGNLNTFGSLDYVSSNNLRIEDKQIELAYQVAAILNLTGVNASTYPLTGGVTAYYFVDGTTTTSLFNARMQSFTASAAGPTGTIVIGSPFSGVYGPEDFGATGYISTNSNGSTRYLYTEKLGTTNSFLNNESLDEGGVVLKGASGDKSLLWIWTDNDTGAFYDSWQSNANLGVDGKTNAIISRVYRSFGYAGVTGSEFMFTAENTKDTRLFLTQTLNEVAPLTFTGPSWRIEKQVSNNYLTFSTGATGICSLSQNFIITPGASGQTFDGIPTNNWARYLNVDMLDGAHGSRTPTAYGIPIADGDGRLDGGWGGYTDTVRKQYTQVGHGLTFGQAVRLVLNTGGFTAASGRDVESAESLGIVSRVISADVFEVTHKGFIEGISGPRMTLEARGFTAGEVYFLGASANAASRGKLTVDPDYDSATAIQIGQVRKAVLLAFGPTTGYVLHYPGVVQSAPTDQVYLRAVSPVGSIQPYAGNLPFLSTAGIGTDWLLCDGDMYSRTQYPDLYQAIGDRYYARVIPIQPTSGNIVTQFRVIGGGRRISSADSTQFHLIPSYSAVGITANAFNSFIDTGILILTYPGTATDTNRIYWQTIGAQVGWSDTGERLPISLKTITQSFFVPDLRNRVLLGGNTGSSNLSFGYNSTFLPVTGGFSGPYLAGELGNDLYLDPTSSAGLTSGTAGDRGYSVVDYIIRARLNTAAVIVSGHNHDDRYHRLNANMVLAATASTFSTDVYKQNVITGAFSIVSATAGGVFGNQTRTVLAAFNITGATQSVTGDARAVTEVMVRGDFTVFGNNLTAAAGSTSRHDGEVFTVRSHESTVSIVGGTGGPYSTTTRRSPQLNFVNGTSSGSPIGQITGLTYPTTNSSAVNRDYSDTSDKVVAAAGGYRGVPSQVGVTGFNIVASKDLSPSGATSYIWSMFANPNRSGGNSFIETYLNGDLTVWGDGISSGTFAGHIDSVFAIDPIRSQVTIEGRSATGRAPILTFLDDSVTINGIPQPANGRIRGLTAPINGTDAVNKDYVDRTVGINNTALVITGATMQSNSSYIVVLPPNSNTDYGNLGMFSNRPMGYQGGNSDIAANRDEYMYLRQKRGVTFPVRRGLYCINFCFYGVETEDDTDTGTAPISNNVHNDVAIYGGPIATTGSSNYQYPLLNFLYVKPFASSRDDDYSCRTLNYIFPLTGPSCTIFINDLWNNLHIQYFSYYRIRDLPD